jgi:MerR family copper efflux transcriptional regulator
MQNGTKIGELAARCGVSPDTVRFYEREGLLPPPERTASGHRVYGQDAFVRLQFIRKARGIGLTLQDIGEILRLRDEGHPEAGPRITTRLRARANAIDQEIANLRVYRRLLDDTIRLCETAASSTLPRLERLFLSAER